MLPDVEQIVRVHLTLDTSVADLVAGRVYTSMPSQAPKDETCVLVRRVGGSPRFSRPLKLDTGRLQIDVYGGPKRAAHDLARIVQESLSEMFGTQTDPDDDDVVLGSVTGVDLGAFRYVPDETWKPPRPRYVLDADVHVKSPDGATVGVAP